jgi:hypothetical protein
LASVARYVGETGKNIEKVFTEAEGLVCSLEHRGWNQLLAVANNKHQPTMLGGTGTHGYLDIYLI